MTKATRQLENGKGDINRGAMIEAISRADGSRGTWFAIEQDGLDWRVKRIDLVNRDTKECMLSELIVIRVLRRGFGSA